MKNLNLKIWMLTAILGAPVWTASIAAAQSGGATCVVDTLLDSSAGLPDIVGSLRDCMNRARSGDTITFDADVFDLTNSDAATTINVLSGLPLLEYGGVTIDASDRRVTVNGSAAGSSPGFVITSSDNQIMGLSIVGFAESGIRIDSGTLNKIGGARDIGTGPNGQGLRLAKNGAFGLEISGNSTSATSVKGCWIGLDASGTSSEANLAGLRVKGGAFDNIIEGNVISGNTLEGLTLEDAGTDNNVVMGNYIGTSATVDSSGARRAAGNGSAGVFISKGTKGSKVGGASTSEGNTIAYNGGNGVEVRALDSKHNSVRGNQIHRNTSGGIALFDGSNDGIRPAPIVSVQNLGANLAGTGLTLRISGLTPQDGNVEVFNDTGSQGETLLGRKDVLTGAWTTDVDVDVVHNLSATLTDALGNTSRFGVFGLTSTDSDDDGVSDTIEGLAETDPDDSSDTPALVQPLNVSKLQIRLNFTVANKDSIKATLNVTLPAGFTVAGATVGVYVAGHSEKFTLDADGKASSSNSSIALKTSAKTGPYLKYGIKQASLQAAVASSGLIDKTTVEDESWVLPVAVTMGDSIAMSTLAVEYKAKAGKTGKAK